MLVDSHCHLDRVDLAPFGGQMDHLMAACHAHDVKHMLCVCIDQQNFPDVLNIAQRYDSVHCSVGMHPVDHAGELVDQDWLIQSAQHSKVVAIGETGLDYYHCKGDVHWQYQRFVQHIEVAKQTKLPLIIHTRQAREDTVRVLKQQDAPPGVFHCFTEDWAMAKQGLDLGYYISFSGIVTFKNAQELKEIAKKVPLDRILVETDAPYLTPAPYRGKANMPGYTRYVAEHIAELRAITYDEIAMATTENFSRLFSVALP
jgi:TatD DNase family protein